jgi:hypothetical protein
MGTAKAFGVYVSFWGVPKRGYGQYVGHLEIGPALGECKIAEALFETPWIPRIPRISACFRSRNLSQTAVNSNAGSYDFETLSRFWLFRSIPVGI